jgi:hypothetical protein
MTFMHQLKEYLEDVAITIKTKFIKLLYTAVLVWGAFPLIFYGILGTLDVLYNHTLNIQAISALINAMFPWWTSVIMNPPRFLLEYGACFMVTIILVHHDILIPSNPN